MPDSTLCLRTSTSISLSSTVQCIAPLRPSNVLTVVSTHRIRTVAVTFPYFGIPASIVFWGQMDSMSRSYTQLSVRLPVTGIHSVMVRSPPTLSAPRKRAQRGFFRPANVFSDRLNCAVTASSRPASVAVTAKIAARQHGRGVRQPYCSNSVSISCKHGSCGYFYYSVRLTFASHVLSQVELESGGVLASLNMTATPGEPYAPTSVGKPEIIRAT